MPYLETTHLGRWVTVASRQQLFYGFSDDLFEEIVNHPLMSRFFTFTSRKSFISTVITCQNPFVRSLYGVTVRRQQNYLVAFQSTIDKNPIITLGRQIHPQAPLWLQSCLETLSRIESNSKNIYIFIDCSDLSSFKSLCIRSLSYSTHPLIFVLNN